MATRTFSVARIDEALPNSFPETVARFEQKVPRADVSVFRQMVTSGASRSEIEGKIQGMAGDLEFMVLHKIDQGPLVSQLGKPKMMSVYLIGNPVIANRMYEEDPATGLYAPLRVEIYEDYGGVTHFTYDRPSSLLEQFQNAKIGAVAQLLDQKMSALTAWLGN
jgi:uncharacterized protein (DUF302 family)